jgi:hypothetical protein
MHLPSSKMKVVPEKKWDILKQVPRGNPVQRSLITNKWKAEYNWVLIYTIATMSVFVRSLNLRGKGTSQV